MFPQRAETVTTLAPGPEQADEHEGRTEQISNTAHVAIVGSAGAASRIGESLRISNLGVANALVTATSVGCRKHSCEPAGEATRSAVAETLEGRPAAGWA